MKVRTKMKTTVGVIVGRFQVANLHQGHRDLIDYVALRNARLLIVLGVPATFATDRNPLPYQMRAEMIRQRYPEAEIIALSDHPSDEVWSENLDALINERCHDCDVTLYGSRDSFLAVYKGSYPTEEFAPHNEVNGTQERAKVADGHCVSDDFLAGMIFCQETRAPLIYQTVDVAVLNDQGQVLLGSKKSDLGKKRFIGGFVDSEDNSLETAARRETREESGGNLEVDGFRYLGSAQIEDWRYRGTKDKCMTSFFAAKRVFGFAKASDDLDTLEWVPVADIKALLIPDHLVLADMLEKYLS